MEENKQEELVIVQNKEQGIGVFSSSNNFEAAQRMAMALSKSTIVPKIYQATQDNPAAVANCIIALETANRIGASPMLVMQNLYIVYGNPGWSSKFLIACLNTCGRFTSLQYEFCGTEGQDDYGCRAWAIEKVTGEKVYGAWVTMNMAKKEGWYGKSGSKWQSMPQLMLQYRSAAFFQRAYAPEISMGMITVEEQEDISYNKHKTVQDINAKIILEYQSEEWNKVVRDYYNGITMSQLHIKYEFDNELEILLIDEVTALKEAEKTKNKGELFNE